MVQTYPWRPGGQGCVRPNSHPQRSVLPGAGMAGLDDADGDVFWDLRDDGPSPQGDASLPGGLAWDDMPRGPTALVIENMDELDTNEPLPDIAGGNGDDVGGACFPAGCVGVVSPPDPNAPLPLLPISRLPAAPAAPPSTPSAQRAGGVLPPAPKKRRLTGKHTAPAILVEEAQAAKANEDMVKNSRFSKEFWDTEFHHVRDTWISTYCNSGSKNLTKGMAWSDKRRLAREAWKAVTDFDKRQLMLTRWREMEDERASGQTPQPRKQGRPPAALRDDHSKGHMSYLLTWNDHTTCHDESVVKAIRVAQKLREDSIQFRVAVKEIAAMAPVVSAREAFLKWWREKADTRDWPEESYQHECSVHASDAGLLHHHVTVSRLALYERAVLIEDRRELKYKGNLPDVEWNKAKGRMAAKACHRSHAYCQVNKTGTLYSQTTYPAPHKFLMQGQWIMDWWRKDKISGALALQELVRWKVPGAQKAVVELEWLVAKAEEIGNKEEQYLVRESLATSFKKFRCFPTINRWKAQYTKRFWGMCGRFKFLVLEGPSKKGKTQLALSLFGIHNTFVTNCQNCTEPCLVGFSRRCHKAIIFDEAAFAMVASSKQMFQANDCGAETGFSATNIHHRWWWLHQIPIIVCTNRWVREEDNFEHYEWLTENCVHVTIDTPVWSEETPVAGTS